MVRIAKADLDQCDYHIVGPYRKKWQRTHGQSLQGTLITVPGPQTAPLYSQQDLLSEGAPLQDRTVPATGRTSLHSLSFLSPALISVQHSQRGNMTLTAEMGSLLAKRSATRLGPLLCTPTAAARQGCYKLWIMCLKELRKEGGEKTASCSTKVVQDNRF